jgi:hypothetical protein
MEYNKIRDTEKLFSDRSTDITYSSCLSTSYVTGSVESVKGSYGEIPQTNYCPCINTEFDSD